MTTTTSVQLIVFGSRPMDDLNGVLADVATAGFPAFEAGDLFASHGEKTAQSLLEKHRLAVSGAHFGYGDYAAGDSLNSHIAYANAVGCKHMMCSGVADGDSIEGYKQSAKVFNLVGQKLADAGISFNYHNHDWEFKDLGGGTTGMQVLAAETDPALVKFNIDVFWLFYANQDPVQFITQYADRAGYFHFKDGRRITDAEGKVHPEFLELGRGEADLKSDIQAAHAVGAEWIVAEQDRSLLPPLEAITISRNYLRDVLGV